MDVQLTRQELAYVANRIESGCALDASDVVRQGIRLLMERDDKERREYERWRADVRQSIEEAYQESLTDEGVDGDAFLEELRIELGGRREPGG